MRLAEKAPEVGKAVRVRLEGAEPWRAAYLEVAGETTHHYRWRMLGTSVPASNWDEWSYSKEER